MNITHSRSVCVGGGVHRRGRVACARVTLLIQHATRVRHTVRGLSGSITFFDVIS